MYAKAFFLPLVEPGVYVKPKGIQVKIDILLSKNVDAGDLPPLLSCGGSAFLTVMTDRFRLREIIGRTLIIHSGADDFHSQPAGNPGAKIACGVIRRT